MDVRRFRVWLVSTGKYQFQVKKSRLLGTLYPRELTWSTAAISCDMLRISIDLRSEYNLDRRTSGGKHKAAEFESARERMATGLAPLDPDAILRESGAWLDGDFILTSGGRGTFYFDSKLFTLNPKYAEFVGKYFFDKLKDSGAVAVGGMALGAIPLVSHIVPISQREGHPLSGFYVRQEPKKHGTLKLIEGKLPEDTTQPVAIIDDIVTGGGSILKAIDAVKEAGYPIVRVMCILDRNEGGREALRERGYELEAMYTAETDENGVKKPVFNP